MTDTTDNALASEARPEFDALVRDLRALVRQQDNIQKAEDARRNATLVMQRASELFAKGRITAHDLARLHAARLRLDLTLPEGERG